MVDVFSNSNSILIVLDYDAMAWPKTINFLASGTHLAAIDNVT